MAYCSVCVVLWPLSKFRTSTAGFIEVITWLWVTSQGSEFAEWPGTGHAVGSGVTTVTTREQAVVAMATSDKHGDDSHQRAPNEAPIQMSGRPA